MDLYGPQIDTTSFYAAALFPPAAAAPPYPGHESITRIGDTGGRSGPFVRVFSADSPTYLSVRPKVAESREDHNITPLSERTLASSAIAKSVTNETHDRYGGLYARTEQKSALAKAAKYRAQLLTAIKSNPGSTIGDDVLARLRLLEKRIEMYAPQVSREQWTRLDRAVGVAESATDLRARVRLALEGG